MQCFHAFRKSSKQVKYFNLSCCVVVMKAVSTMWQHHQHRFAYMLIPNQMVSALKQNHHSTLEPQTDAPCLSMVEYDHQLSS